MPGKLTVTSMSVGALAAAAVTAAVIRRNRRRLPPELAAQIEELVDRIRAAEADPERTQAASRLHTRLVALDLPGVRWHTGFTKWEIISLRLRALASGLPSDDTLNQLEQELDTLAADADAHNL